MGPPLPSARIAELYDQLFFSHFGLGEDIGDVNLVDRYLVKAGADATSIGRATLEGTANATINESEQAARRVDVAGTPAWFVEDQLLNGLKPKRLVEQVVTRCAGFSQWAEHRNNISRSVTFGSAPNTICICGRPRIRFSPQ
jgi:predicted DsbA family dithiol-disulfide isomerase